MTSVDCRSFGNDNTTCAAVRSSSRTGGRPTTPCGDSHPPQAADIRGVPRGTRDGLRRAVPRLAGSTITNRRSLASCAGCTPQAMGNGQRAPPGSRRRPGSHPTGRRDHRGQRQAAAVAEIRRRGAAGWADQVKAMAHQPPKGRTYCSRSAPGSSTTPSPTTTDAGTQLRPHRLAGPGRIASHGLSRSRPVPPSTTCDPVPTRR